jgi:hypothetical protein
MFPTRMGRMGTEADLIFNLSQCRWLIRGMFRLYKLHTLRSELIKLFSVTSSFLPSMTLPATRTPPIFSNSQTPTTAPARSQSKGVIIGESLGPALGVLLFASAWAAVILRRRRMRNMRIEASERHWGDYERGRHTQRAQDREASKWF